MLFGYGGNEDAVGQLFFGKAAGVFEDAVGVSLSRVYVHVGELLAHKLQNGVHAAGDGKQGRYL